MRLRRSRGRGVTTRQAQVEVETLFSVVQNSPVVSARDARRAVRRTREAWLRAVVDVDRLSERAPGSPRLDRARRRATRLHDRVLEAMRELDAAAEGGSR